ncbi:MAG TPA: lysophospholipid acyltransferase family protein [Bacteroidota bacterium]|nr:lysophospholipid acyltransferase family protein [Bacteroidota bacterium]
MRSFRFVLEYLLFAFIAAFVRILPLQTARSIGAWVGEAVYSLTGFRKSITNENLQKAFPEKSAEEIQSLALRSFRSIGTTFFELFWTENLTAEELQKEVKFQNPELVKTVQQKGKGVVLMTGHYGNWEWFAHSVNVSTGMPLHVIAKAQHNPYVDEWINRTRRHFGNVVIPMSASVRETLRVLSEGGVVGIVGDQSAAKESVWVEFFGRRVPTHQGPAVFSLKTGAPMLVGFTQRQPDGTYVAEFRNVPMNDLTAYTPENVEELTRRHVKMMEEIIRSQPEQWMWMHRRWKHAESTAVNQGEES